MNNWNNRIIGIDCAVSDKNIGIALAEYVETPKIKSLVPGEEGKVIPQIVEWSQQSGSVLLALDAPLGWPESMGSELKGHKAGEPIATERNDFFNRATDSFIWEKFGKRPLEVGASLIARTAHATLELLGNLRDELNSDIPLAWEPEIGQPGIRAIEVYPAATVIAHGLPQGGHHGEKNKENRKQLIDYIQERMKFEWSIDILDTNPHVLDAALCVLAGMDFLKGDTILPPEETPKLKEGWIWVKSTKY